MAAVLRRHTKLLSPLTLPPLQNHRRCPPPHPSCPPSSHSSNQTKKPSLPFFSTSNSSPPLNSNTSMASVFRCAGCGTDLKLKTTHQYPAGTYLESKEKRGISFSWVDETKFRFIEESKIRPFFETVDYWGVEKRRIKMQCKSCGRLVGYEYRDGSPMRAGSGEWALGLSQQAFPRAPRYRFKIKALNVAQDV